MRLTLISPQVPGSSAIQCYSPATGRSLGLVNPSTPDGIDRAVARARAAQTEWAKTTFAQRRRVLRTMLKLVRFFPPSPKRRRVSAGNLKGGLI